MILDEYVSNNKTKVWFQTLEQIFNKTHNNKYDYTNSVVKNATTKIEVICLIHGSFHITPDSHKRGSGCSLCAKETHSIKITKTTQEFVMQANHKHNNLYDYSSTNYVGAHQKVEIICKIHGTFKQTPDSHLHGCGCPECSISTPNTPESFIESANKIHNNKYDYSNVNITSLSNKVGIICPEHGLFYQNIREHAILGQGCPKCARNFKLNTSMFIEKSNKIHNSKYIYDKVEYKRWDVKVDIICTLHGIFKQTPNSHLHGCGCPSCGVITSSKITNYNRYKNKMTTLYYIKINNMYKIGLTRTSVESRFKVEIQNGVNIKILKTIEFEDGWKAYIIEQAVLAEATYGKISKDSSPITAGWTEIRKMCFLDIIYKNLKEKNEEN